ncbi:MAG TPA: ubiquinone biosynthesis regulatory protein kinase UbiB [Gammaproteobacteria bacterium]|nr:ubiquinone biosynthesis regulatory protein kinase UbiB [Gammaproteobacteria bacterium]
MRRIRLVLRLITIQRTLVRHGLDQIVTSTHLFRPLGFLNRLLSFGGRRKGPLGRRIRLALEELGPLFVKFGQAVSVRRDLLPEEIANELALLQDHVPPFPSAQAIAMIEQALGRTIEECFGSFDAEPLAAASVAQVHSATLKDGSRMVVKVLRPGIGKQINADIEVLHALAQLAERYWPPSQRLRPVAVVEEFETTLSNEIDLMREAANASQLKRNFAGTDLLYVPEVHWDLCRRNVLTLERIEGVPISDRAALVAAGTNIERLAKNGVEIFFTQVFRHNFFHADMHPGNVFVDVTDPERPKYVAIDFGIMGTLTREDQRYLAGNFLAFFQRDYRRIARLHVDSGWVPPHTRVDEFESAVRAVCEPIFDKPLKEISFGLVLVRLFETARRFDMEVQPQLVLLQKTLLAIEGLGRDLYPELDLWTTAKPILEDWMRERSSPVSHLKRLIDDWPEISEDLIALPNLLHSFVRERERSDNRPPRPDRRHHRLAGIRARRMFAGAVFLIGGVLWLGFDLYPVAAGVVSSVLGALVLAAGALRR